MARKRGGLAGIWDRNKGAIKALAPIALGAIPGVGVPLAAVAGAAMGGLDRPGKGGIGLDLGGALKGGATGYLGGQTGKALAGGIKGMLTANQIKPVNIQPGLTPDTALTAPSIDTSLRTSAAGGFTPNPINAPILQRSMPTSLTSSAAPGALPGIGMPTATARGINVAAPSGTEAGRSVMDMLRGAGRGIASAADSAGSFASRNKDLLTMAGKGLMSQLPNRELDIDQQKIDLQRQQYEDEKAQREERQMALQKFFMPYLEQTQKRRFDYGGTYGG